MRTTVSVYAIACCDMNTQQVHGDTTDVPLYTKNICQERRRAQELSAIKTAPPTPVATDHEDVKSQSSTENEDAKAAVPQATRMHDGALTAADTDIRVLEQAESSLPFHSAPVVGQQYAGATPQQLKKAPSSMVAAAKDGSAESGQNESVLPLPIVIPPLMTQRTQPMATPTPKSTMHMTTAVLSVRAPSASTSPATVTDQGTIMTYRSLVVSIYQRYNPDKLPEVDKILLQYA